jgi:prolyl oligopeptidase
MDYPRTRRDDTVETLHGQEVADPYRWLEDPDSPETRAWVAEQNRLSRAHLDGLASHPWFEDTMSRIVRSPRAGTPDRVGSRYVVSRNDGTQQQDLWFVADSLEELAAGGRLLLDPNSFSADGTSSLAGYDVSEDGRWLAYQVSDGGSDWTSIRLRDLEAGHDVDDVVTKVKFSDATWLPDGSYLYSWYPTEGAGVGTEAGVLPGGQVRRHRVGERQADDELLLEFPEDPRIGASPKLAHDGRWLAMHIHEGTSEKNRLWFYPVGTQGGASTVGEPLKVVDEPTAGFHVVRFDGDQVYVHTDLDAERGRVVRLDLTSFPDTGRVDLVEVVPESDAAIEQVRAVGDELLVVRLADARPRITRHALDGSEVAVVDVDGGQVMAVHGKAGEDEVFLGLSSVTRQLASYRLDLTTGTVEEVTGLEPAGEVWTPPEVVSERRRATSPDGTEVPYFLVHRADVPLDAPRPTLLWGYGGFNVPELARYRPAYAGWLAAGGVLVIANLRGGGEFGSAWHDAGRLERKQNVFDDYLAVADHLVDSGVTTHDRLALYGGSNGGLLVGAAITQRPDVAAVALPSVGVMDMLRFHLFTIGAAWVSDYGSPEDPEMFPVLRAYSPLHNLRDGTAYPATLVLTGDHDDRVVPAHSFKLTAALQRAQGGDAPVLARIETSTGHSLGKPLTVVAAETADLLAFAAEHTGLRPERGPA